MPERRWRKYEVLLRVRQRQERLKAQALAEVLRGIRSEEAQREAIAEQQKKVLMDAGATAREEFMAAQVHAFFQFERHLAGQAVEKDATIRRLRDVEEGRRAELELAMKRRRMIERLSDRARLAYVESMRKAEQKQSDENAGNYAARATDRPRGART